MTLVGTSGQIILGVFGVDLPMDIRDTVYNISNWEWTWKHAGKTLLDGIGLIPIIGVVKNIDEVFALAKGTKVGDGVKRAGSVADVSKNSKWVSHVDNVEDVGTGVAKDIIAKGKLDETLKPFKRLTNDEKRVVEALIDEGKNVKLMPETPKTGQSYDFLVNDIPTELKTLNKGNTNTLISSVKRAFKQLNGDGQIICDISKANFTDEQMQEIYARLKGLYKDDVINKIIFRK